MVCVRRYANGRGHLAKASRRAGWNCTSVPALYRVVWDGVKSPEGQRPHTRVPWTSSCKRVSPWHPRMGWVACGEDVAKSHVPLWSCQRMRCGSLARCWSCQPSQKRHAPARHNSKMNRMGAEVGCVSFVIPCGSSVLRRGGASIPEGNGLDEKLQVNSCEL